MSLPRLEALSVGGKSLPLPVYFPSISSVKTALPPIEYLQVLSSLTRINRQFLISAFDLASLEANEIAKKAIKTAQDSQAIILMDSGNYESFWKDKKAFWKSSDFHNTLQTFPCDLTFSFDEQSPPANIEEHIALISSRWQEDQKIAGECAVIPIVHGSLEELPILCNRVSKMTGVSIIAVPERRLGDGILQRAQTVSAIREELNTLGRYVVLHLLGTGNPISITLYAMQGADSFDGLEWCQTVVDYNTALLFHLSQADFFTSQSQWENEEISFQARTLAHNLGFYTDWMDRLRIALANDDMVNFCRFNFPENIFQKCKVVFGWS